MILKIILVLCALAFITFSIPTLMSTDLVACTTINYDPQIIFKLGFLKFTVETPGREKMYFDYSDTSQFPWGGTAPIPDIIRRRAIGDVSISSSSSSITSKTYTSFGLLSAANALLAVLIFVFWFEIFFLKNLVIFLLLSMAIFTITAFSLIITLVQPAKDFILILVQGQAVSSTLDPGATMFIAVLVVGIVFVLSAFFFMRQKGLFSENTYYTQPS